MKPSTLVSLLIPLLGAAALSAQPQTTLNVTLPRSNPIPRTSDTPFRHDKVHYQQWYQGSQFAPNITQAVRIVGLRFGGSLPTGTNLDIEVRMANGGSSLAGLFATNLLSNDVVVIPRSQIAITGGPLQLDFVNDWVYDGSSNVVIDIKIFGNGTGGPIAFAGASTILQSSNTKRQYFIGNANAAVANSSGSTGHYGLMTTFLFQEGGTYEYGSGCPGGFNVLPVGSTNNIPLPGDALYEQQLSNAGSGYPAVFVLGISDSTWTGASLPLPLDFLGGLGCTLNASADVMLWTTTVGGGPGSGAAKLPTPIPAIGALAGAVVYSQWIVFDLAAPNGRLSATRGLRHVVGS